MHCPFCRSRMSLVFRLRNVSSLSPLQCTACDQFITGPLREPLFAALVIILCLLLVSFLVRD